MAGMDGEAGAPGGGARLAARKHQITSLLRHARVKEAEYGASAASGMKTKGETRAKYGW